MEAVVLPGLRSVGARPALRWSRRALTEPHLVLSAPTHPAPYLTHHTTSNPPAWRALSGIQNDDVVAVRRPDGLYEIRQCVDNELVMIRLGVFDRKSAEKTAIELAN